MKPEQQNVAIAEACGLNEPTFRNWKEDGDGGGAMYYPEDNLELPDYPNDLNAMHEAEKSLTKDERWHYVKDLLSVVGGGNLDDYGDLPIKAITATAAQKAEAFLKAKKLWK